MSRCYGWILTSLVLLFAFAVPVHAQLDAKVAAVDMFLKIEGIDGESQDAEHKDWIIIESYSHGLTNEVLVGGGGGGAGAPAHGPITVTKQIDKSSLRLFDVLNKGEMLRTATFEFLEPGGEQSFLFLKVDLEEAYVTSYGVSASAGGSRPFEAVSFVYTRITLTYWPRNPDGSQGPPIVVGWDVSKNLPTSVAMDGVEAWVEGRDVLFRWQTTSQTGNYGFEVQKLEESGFKRAAYVPGAGWSSEPLEYEVRIRGLQDGVHVFRVASLGVGGLATYSEEMSIALGLPDDFSLTLDAPYPNPFSDRTNIAVTVARPQDARISVWDMLGREVAVVHDGRIGAGFTARYQFDTGARLSAGAYVLRVQTEDAVETRLLTVTR